jgi:hypothetical protein
MVENKQDHPEDTTSQAMVLMGRLLALEGEIAGLKSGAGFVSGDVCAQLAGWIPGGGEGGDGGGGIDLSVFSFGCAFSGTQVIVLGGYVRRGFRAPVYVAGASFGLAGVRWSYITYNFQSGAASLTTNASSIPDDTATETYIALHQYHLASGVAGVTSGGVHHVGDIFLPGETA